MKGWCILITMQPIKMFNAICAFIEAIGLSFETEPYSYKIRILKYLVSIDLLIEFRISENNKYFILFYLTPRRIKLALNFINERTKVDFTPNAVRNIFYNKLINRIENYWGCLVIDRIDNSELSFPPKPAHQKPQLQKQSKTKKVVNIFKKLKVW